jgi:hypothetical protein
MDDATKAITVQQRGAELQRRAMRREDLLQRLKNEGKLLEEELTAEEMEIHMKAVNQVYVQSAIYDAQLEAESIRHLSRIINERGYWKNLWLALKGRIL